MISNAVQFFLAGERTSRKAGFSTYPEHTLPTVYIVLYSFSLEVIIKTAVLLTSGEFKKGHDINILFGHLDEKYQDKIRTYMVSSSRGKSRFETMLSSLNGVNSSGALKSPFELWRYDYEKSSIKTTTGFLRELFIATHKFIRSEFPDVISSYERKWGHIDFDPSWCAYTVIIPDHISDDEDEEEQRALDKEIWNAVMMEPRGP